MGMKTFKKMIVVSSLAVIAISANAQDREEEHSLVSTGLRVHAPEVQVDENAQEDDSGLANVVFDQLVIQPCQGLLSTAMGFCKFAQQHPFAAFTLTAAYALPVVAALLPEPSPNLWYPQFTCASSADTLVFGYDGGGPRDHSRMLMYYAPADGKYLFTPYTGTHGYPTARECANRTMWEWHGPGSPAAPYADCNCTQELPWTDNGPWSYMWAKANYTAFMSGQHGQSIAVTSWCAQVPAP